MDIRFWSDDGQPAGLVGIHPISPRAGFVDVPEGTSRITLTFDSTVPQVWLLSVDGRREYCAHDDGAPARPCTAPARVLVVAEYSDGRVLTRMFCVDHGQDWAEEVFGRTVEVAVHDMRYREDVPDVHHPNAALGECHHPDCP